MRSPRNKESLPQRLVSGPRIGGVKEDALSGQWDAPRERLPKA